MAKPRTADLSSAPTADQIVCACKNLTYGTLSELAVSTGSFDEVMARSGAGQECTACLLDLEYYFGLQQVGTGWQDGKLAPNVNRADSPKLRHRIFALLDSLSPLSPQRLRDLGPILRCEGISQHLIIANHSLLFDEKRSTPDMSVRVDVRDQNGTLCRREESVLGIDDRMDLCISDFLPKPEAGEISIGSVVVERRAVSPGYRGTMRPQTLLEAPHGTCAVHLQASNKVGDIWLNFLHRPKDERMFFGLLNDTAGELEFSLNYRYDADETIRPATETVMVPPLGSRLHEYRPALESIERLEDTLARVKVSAGGKGGRKVYFLCASPDLGRFSIDHA